MSAAPALESATHITGIGNTPSPILICIEHEDGSTIRTDIEIVNVLHWFDEEETTRLSMYIVDLQFVEGDQIYGAYIHVPRREIHANPPRPGVRYSMVPADIARVCKYLISKIAASDSSDEIGGVS